VTSHSAPERAAPIAPIGLPGAVGLSILVVLVLVLGVPILANLRSALGGAPPGSSSEPDRLVLGLAQLLGLGVALGVGLQRYGRGEGARAALHLGRVGPLRLLAAFTAGFALQFPLAELGNLLHERWPMDPAQVDAIARLVTIDGLRDAVEVFLLLCVLAPVGEELLFRGLLLPGLRARHGTTTAVVASAALFGAVHLEPVSAVLAALVGAVLGLLAVRSGSTLPPIALHFGFNFAPVLLQRPLVRIEGFNTLEPGVYHVPLALVVAALTVAALALSAFYRLDPEGTR